MVLEKNVDLCRMLVISHVLKCDLDGDGEFYIIIFLLSFFFI